MQNFRYFKSSSRCWCLSDEINKHLQLLQAKFLSIENKFPSIAFKLQFSWPVYTYASYIYKFQNCLAIDSWRKRNPTCNHYDVYTQGSIYTCVFKFSLIHLHVRFHFTTLCLLLLITISSKQYCNEQFRLKLIQIKKVLRF